MQVQVTTGKSGGHGAGRHETWGASSGSLTERLLTHPDAFNLTTASPLQRAICRALDGVPLGQELTSDPDVQWGFGGAEALDELLLAFPGGVLPAEVILCAAVRCAKTLMSAALAFKACLTVDLSHTRRNEPVRFSIVSIDKDKASVAIEHLNATIPEAKILRPYFVRSTKFGVIIRHPTGRLIEIRVIVPSRGGGGVVSRWSAGLVADEAARMQGKGAVCNLPDVLRAVHGRLLPGAPVFMPGAPWSPSGPIFDAVQDEWGKPKRARVVIRGRGPMLNPAWWTPERIAEVRALKDGELIVQTDVMAEFGDLESSFFTSQDIAKATRAAPPQIPYDPSWDYAAFMDPATRGNAWTVVIVGKRPGASEGDATYAVVYCQEWRGTKSQPLRAKDVFRELAPVLADYGLSDITSDGWSVDTIAEIAEDARPSITVHLDDASQVDKDKRFLDFREVVIADPPRISLAPDPLLRADLLAIKRLLTASGMRFPLPLTGDGRHADFAPSTVGAFAAAKSAMGWVNALERGRQKGFFVEAEAEQ
jgi:hypothetical protein